MLVSLEGSDGAGKTTQVRLLGRALAGREPLLVREPGGTAFGERVRDLVLHGGGFELGPQAEAFLFMAARAELLEERVRPALAAGRLVLCDRYHDATRAYQGVVGGAEVPWPEAFPRPSLTVLLALPPEVGLRRQAAEGKSPDRLEARSLEFHQRVAEAYLTLAAEEPERWLVVDATDPPARICAAVSGRVEELLAAEPSR
ncbi:MAG: dTMP kinase [Candidatus Dormibacteraceae bacterium]